MCIFNEIGGFRSKLLFSLHVFFFFLVFVFNFTVVIIKSYVSLLTLFFSLIIQNWNKNINVIYFSHHFFLMLFKYIFKVNIFFFFSVFVFTWTLEVGSH